LVLDDAAAEEDDGAVALVEDELSADELLDESLVVVEGSAEVVAGAEVEGSALVVAGADEVVGAEDESAVSPASVAGVWSTVASVDSAGAVTVRVVEQASPVVQVASEPCTVAVVLSASPSAALSLTVTENVAVDEPPPAIGSAGVQVSVPLSLSRANPAAARSPGEVVIVDAAKTFDTSSTTVTEVSALSVAVFATFSV